MITPNDIIGLFNTTCQKGLNDAAAICSQERISKIEIETLIYYIGKDHTSDISKIFSHFKVYESDLSCQARSINGVIINGSHLPTFALSLAVAIDVSSRIGLAKFRIPAIRSGFLLLAFLTTDDIANRAKYSLISKINIRELTEHYLEITSGSAETNVPAEWDRNPIPSASPTSFTIDLTAKARANQLDPVIGRQSEIRQLIEILCRRRQNNPILVGDAGVGKSALVEALAQRIIADEVPPKLKGASILALDMGLLNAGAHAKGEFETRINSIISDIKKSKSVLFIDEVHTIVGSVIPNGMPDAANLFKPALARGELRCIGATTWPEYKQAIERDTALKRRFHRITVNEPTRPQAIEMVRGIVPNLAEYHDVSILDEAVEASVNFSARYIPDLKLPDKAISILDLACVRGGSIIGTETVAEVVSDWTGIARGRIAGTEEEILTSLDTSISSLPINGNLSSQIISHIKTCQSLNVPVSYLLSGFNLSEKITLAKLMAEHLFGDTRSLLNINMGDYYDPHSINSLKGSPAGYTGSIEGGFLTEAVRRRPGTVVLARGMEMACRNVVALFEEICDQGFIRDGLGNEIDFRNSVVIITTETNMSFRCESTASFTFATSRLIQV